MSTPMCIRQHTCDVCVVGTGPSGAATALALARRGVKVVLLDVASRRSRSPGESLNGVAMTCLRELGLWSRGFNRHVRPSYLSEIAWERPDVRPRRAIEQPWGPDLHLDRAAFDAWLSSEAIRGGATAVHGARIEDVQVDRANRCVRCSVATSHGDITIESHALVDATGRAAAIVRRLGGRLVAAPDRVVAVNQVFDAPLAQPSVLIEAVEDGWWYSAPLPDDRSVAIFFTDPALANGRVSRPEYFDEALASTTRTRARFNGLRRETSPTACAAGPSLTLYDVSLPIVPVGDAATAFDPLSGDGLCFALRSALEAAATLTQFAAGDRSALAAYASGVNAVFMRHVTRRAILYNSVTRFGDAPFWSRTRLMPLVNSSQTRAAPDSTDPRA
jgi:flavin-dependent dehydrogenase